MEPRDILIALAAIGVGWYVVSSLRIYDALRRRQYKVHFLFLNVLILKYASDYRDLTRKETGRTDSLYYQWIISINVALACVLLLFLLGAF